jgi:membrane protein
MRPEPAIKCKDIVPARRELPDLVHAPWTVCKTVLVEVYEHVNDHRLLAVAAGTVFYVLLALFPAITALVSCYALIAKGDTINEHLAWLAGLMPQGSFSIVQDQVGRVLAEGDAKLGMAFLFSLALALWSANGGVKAIIDSLNVVYGEQ